DKWSTSRDRTEERIAEIQTLLATAIEIGPLEEPLDKFLKTLEAALPKEIGDLLMPAMRSEHDEPSSVQELDAFPWLHFYCVREQQEDPFMEQRHVPGIRLDKFDLKQKKSDPFNGPIEVCLLNPGGTANGAVGGGCTVYYVPKRVGEQWTVEFDGLVDP